MVNDIQLMTAMQDSFRRIAAVLALLQGPEYIDVYIDSHPDKNSAGLAIYKMAPGSLLIVWSSTSIDRASESRLGWVHAIQVYVRAKRGESALNIIHALVDGVPDPGDGQCWRLCPLISEVMATEIGSIDRLIDEEGIDYYVVATITQETGDTP